MRSPSLIENTKDSAAPPPPAIDLLAPIPLSMQKDGDNLSYCSSPSYSCSSPSYSCTSPPLDEALDKHSIQESFSRTEFGKEDSAVTQPAAPVRTLLLPPEQPEIKIEYPNDFPCYQDCNGTWYCKHCNYIYPQTRDQFSTLSTPADQPLNGYYIDQHLARCRIYQEKRYETQLSIPTFPQNHVIYPQWQPRNLPPATPVQTPGRGPALNPRPLGPFPISPHPFSIAQDEVKVGNSYVVPLQRTSYASSRVLGETVQLPQYHPVQYSQPVNYMGHELPPRPSTPKVQPQQTTRIADKNGGEVISPQRTAATHAESSQVAEARYSPARNAIEYLSALDKELRTPDSGGITTVRHAIKYLSKADKELRDKQINTTSLAQGQLVLEEDRPLLTDFFYFLMKQLRFCRFSETDRKSRGGKRVNINIGYGGLQCIHCAEEPNPRKFFWSNVDRLANSFSEISSHVLRCLCCPRQAKHALLKLKDLHQDQIAEMPRGSQKIFFRRMWSRLHAGDASVTSADAAQKSDKKLVSMPPNSHRDVKDMEDYEEIGNPPPPPVSDASCRASSSDESIVSLQNPRKEASMVSRDDSEAVSMQSASTARVLLGIPEDKDWLADIDCIVREQIEVFRATKRDCAVIGSDYGHTVHEGQIGIRCVHCALSIGKSASSRPHASGIAFPRSINHIYDSVRDIQNSHLGTCKHLPKDVRSKLMMLKKSFSDSSVAQKYYVVAAKTLGLKNSENGIGSAGLSMVVANDSSSVVLGVDVPTEKSSIVTPLGAEISGQKRKFDEQGETKAKFKVPRRVSSDAKNFHNAGISGF